MTEPVTKPIIYFITDPMTDPMADLVVNIMADTITDITDNIVIWGQFSTLAMLYSWGGSSINSLHISQSSLHNWEPWQQHLHRRKQHLQPSVQPSSRHIHAQVDDQDMVV